MKGGSRCACGREPAGQLPTSSTMSERAASTQGSSKVAVGRQRTQVRQVGGSGPGGGHCRDHSIRRWSKLSQNGHGRPVLVGPQRPPASAARRGRARRAGRRPRARGPRPRRPTRPWRRARAGPPGVISTRWASTVRPGPQRRDHEVDRREGGHREVVAEEAGGTGEGALGPGGPQRDGGHVPAAGAPDLPVGVHHGA